MEGEVEVQILDSSVNINTHFLKVAHHGSKTSTTEEFIEKTSPQVAVITAGEDNRYGHPHEDTIERLDNYNIDIYTTARNGNIVIITDGESYSVRTEYNSKLKVLEEKEEYNQKDPPEDKSEEEGKFVGSVNSDKYHWPSCRWAENIKEENEIWFVSTKEAQEAGYEACGTCSPPS